jgi:quercetin dioxygenase-like cupin family protein
MKSALSRTTLGLISDPTEQSKKFGGGIKRAIRWAPWCVALAGVVTAVTVGSAAATPPSALTNVALARGTNTSRGTIPLQFGTDIAMVQITVNPGGSSGWHSHPGGAIVVVKQGSLTVYSPVGKDCETTTYSAGQAFIERPGELDDVLNNGTVPYILYVTFPRVPQGESARTDQPDPGVCPGL